MPLLLILVVGMLSSPPTEAFTVGPGINVNVRRYKNSNVVKLWGARDAYFQLEEREDAEVCITEVYLKSDGTVQVLESDGPPCTSATGSWTQQIDSSPEFGRSHTKGSLEMTLRRSYETGYSKRKATDMGKFGYDVVRTYKGDFEAIGNKLGVSGKIFITPTAGGGSGRGGTGEATTTATSTDEEVGFFEMIDTTDERVNDHCSGPSSQQPDRSNEGKVRITPMGP